MRRRLFFLMNALLTGCCASAEGVPETAGEREIPVTSFPGIRIGQTENAEAGTGVTVLLCEHGMRAGLDVARAVARRAERRFRVVAQKFVADKKAMQYMNRLSDFLYVSARYADYKAENIRSEGVRQEVIRDILKEPHGSRRRIDN